MKHSPRSGYPNQFSSSISLRHSCFFVLLFCTFFQARSQHSTPFVFELKTYANTSAGVFKKDSTLVRTLWNNVPYPAGKHSAKWDGKDDEGRLATDTGLVIRVLSNNVKYMWEGVIGNTSDSFTGSTVIRMFDRMHDMAISRTTAYYGAGYTEGITSSYKFSTSDPQKKYNIPFNGIGEMRQSSDFVTTDDTNVYWGGYDPFNASSSFVFATRVADDSEVLFSKGVPVAVTYGKTYLHAIDTGSGDLKKMITGMAVQKKGKYLFVSHAGSNALHVLDKRSGAPVQNLQFSAPRNLAMDMNDSLWILSGTGIITKHGTDSNGNISPAVLTLANLKDPLDMAVSPDNKTLVVVDGGSSQQLKAFDNSNGNPLWIYGQQGGYANDPAVTNDKFYFSDSVTRLSKPFITFQPDSSFWVADVGNERIQHYDANLGFIDRIMSLPHSYSVSADINDPTRVFNEYLEFRIDYSKPLAPDNGSWTLVRNWRHGIKEDYFREGMFNIFTQVVTLGNGRTYATLENAKNQNARYPEIVELPASGQLRYTGVRFADFAGDQIDADGTLRRFVSNSQVNSSGYWENQTLNGFTGSNDPAWGTAEKIASIPTIKLKDPANGNMSFPAMTRSGLLVLFDNGRLNQGFHLGAVKKGSSKYLWKASRATTRQYEGPFPADGAYDIGNHVEYAGGHVYAADEHIFWNYHGEFWKSSQVNKWNHYYSNGLMIGQFGITTPEGEHIQKEAFPMGAGNVFSARVVKVGQDYYIYHNDESVHAGIHRWKISDLNTVEEQIIPLSYASGASGGLNGSYFDGSALDNTRLKISMLQHTINVNKAPSQIVNQVDFSARYTGFITPGSTSQYTLYLKSSKGCRLWVDGTLIIDQWSNASQNEFSAGVTLEEGKLHPVKIEMNGGRIAFSWSGNNVSKQIVPAGNLYPDYPDNDQDGIDLLEGLSGKSMVENLMYGWQRNAQKDDSTSDNSYWHVRTGIKSYDTERPDLYMTFKRDIGLYTVSRTLGNFNSCMSTWTLSGQISFDGNFPSWDNNGGAYIDVLDDQGKIISRLSCEAIYDQKIFPTTLKCNGEEVFNAPFNTVLPVLSSAQPFEMVATQSGIVFRYSNFVALSTPVFDAACNWKKPKTLNFYFKGGTSNYKRVIDIGSLRFKAPSQPVISLLGPDIFCEGSSVTLRAKKSKAYHWSNGSRDQQINVTSSGNFFVSTTDETGCSGTSQVVNVQSSPLPSPVISENQGILSSSIDNGNQWYFKGEPISGATSKTYKANDTGYYTLVVTDSNNCVGTATFFHKTSLSAPGTLDRLKLFPNPSQGRIFIRLQPDINGTISVYDITGLEIIKIPARDTEINLGKNANGLYTLLLSTEVGNYYYKLVIQ